MMDLLECDLDSVPMSDKLQDFLYEYQSMEIIGEGGFGKVRKAISRRDKQKVAIKFIANSKITSWHFHSKLNQFIPMEIALMCRCRQVNGVIKILKYFHIEEHQGWYIVMERFENYIDLFDHITNMGQISEKEASNFMKQMINILVSCHNLGVCHRDIKDENIIIDLTTKKIYLIDFGAGGILRDGFYTEFDGTRVYSPPEWILNKRYQAISLEIWSLGILLYDMVCGNLPYDNDESIINCCLAFRRPISRSCQDLIVSCLEKNPENRPNLSSILKHRWFNNYSKFNPSEIPKSPSQTGGFLHSNFHSTQINSSLPTYSHFQESSSRRISGETSPFVTPQSSGFEDGHTTNDPLADGIYKQKVFHDSPKISNPCRSSDSTRLFHQKHINNKNSGPHTFITFDFNMPL